MSHICLTNHINVCQNQNYICWRGQWWCRVEIRAAAQNIAGRSTVPRQTEDKVLGTEAVSSGRNVQILFRDFKNTEMFEMAEYYLF